MGTAHATTLQNTTIHGLNNAMDRKNIDRGFKKLRVRQDAVALVKKSCGTNQYSNIPVFQPSMSLGQGLN